MDFTGRPAKGMVFAGPGGLHGAGLREWLDAAAAFSRTLPPKAARCPWPDRPPPCLSPMRRPHCSKPPRSGPGCGRSWRRGRPRGARVNAVSPGPARAEGTEVTGGQLDQLASLAPAGRPAAPEEIASAISYLAGDQASFVHGAILDVDGGRNAA
jgi:hypothetical protein